MNPMSSVYLLTDPSPTHTLHNNLRFLMRQVLISHLSSALVNIINTSFCWLESEDTAPPLPFSTCTLPLSKFGNNSYPPERVYHLMKVTSPLTTPSRLGQSLQDSLVLSNALLTHCSLPSGKQRICLPSSGALYDVPSA